MVIGPKSLFLRALMWLLIAVSLACGLLQAGIWTRTETFKGPFNSHPQFANVQMLTLGNTLPLRCCLSTGGDTRDDQDRSRARFTIDGRPSAPAHQQPRQVALSRTGFGHWDNEIVFALAPDKGSGKAVTAQVTYPVMPRIRAAEPAGLALLLALFLYGRRMSDPRAARLFRLPGSVTLGLLLALFAAGFAYAVAVVQAALAGATLPTASPIQDHGWAEVLAISERSASYILLALAVLGALCRYLGTRRDSRLPNSLDEVEGRLLRVLAMCGLPAALLLGILCVSAPWAGQPVAGEIGAATIAGLIPLSDAAGYLADGYGVQAQGNWGDFSARRSVAAAFRTFTLLAGGNSEAGMLIVQAVLVVAALFVAAVSVVRWRGIWAGLAFFAICYGIIRGYLATSLTEPLGFFWALLAIPFLINAVRDRSLVAGLAGLAILTLALLTRMGAMFAAPALALWLIWHFGQSWPARIRIAVVVAVAMLLPVLFNTILQKTFTDGTTLIGSNFSYTLCGLSVGSNWTGCLDIYARERNKPGVDAEALLYKTAVENILDRPHVFAAQLFRGGATFAARLPELLVKGVDGTPSPVWFPAVALFIGALTLLIAAGWRNLEPGEATFWLLLGLATLASAAFVYFDAGRRVMIVIYPLAALLLVSGLGGVRPSAAHRK
ncbi:MAG: hypothetical protein VX871_02860, partial [Pseudomonadota bacterium]|nr:hypothetical protein [Pseudomonadota bacterium]